MPRDGNGTFSLPAGNPVVTGTTISSTVQNNTMNEVAAALTASIASDGQTTPTADLKMGAFKHKNVGNAGSRISTNANYASAADVQDGTITYLTAVAGTNTVTASAPLGLAAYVTGQRFVFIPAATNSGATTLSINSIGAKNVFYNGAASTGSDLMIGQAVEVEYDGTQFQIMANAGFGGQIKFPATQNPSSNVNTLDDYEEGTWTPAIKFGALAVGITYSQQLGTYTKVGNLVTAMFYVTLTSKGSSNGSATVTGLPFTSDNTMLGNTGSVYWSAMTGTYVALVTQLSNGSTSASFMGATAAATGLSAITDTGFSNTSNLIGTITYRV